MARPCGKPKNSRGRMRTKESGVFGGLPALSLGPDPNPRLGPGRGPLGQSLPGGHVGIP